MDDNRGKDVIQDGETRPMKPKQDIPADRENAAHEERAVAVLSEFSDVTVGNVFC